MAKKDPAFLFYTSDFLTGTMLMNNEQVGIYIKLLCVQHQHGGLIDKTSFNAMVNTHDVVRIKFVETEDGFYNQRLMEEMVKRTQKSCNLSANAHKRWNNLCKGNAIASNLHMPTEDENEDVNIKERKDRIVKERKENQPPKTKHLSCVYLTEEQHAKLITRFGDEKTKQMIFRLNNYIESKGKHKTYKSHYHTILNWDNKNDPVQA